LVRRFAGLRRIGAPKAGPLYADAIEGRLDHWKDHPDGALALCILFDQVPRNIFRGSARAFATDTEARSFATRNLASTGRTRRTTTACSATYCLEVTPASIKVRFGTILDSSKLRKAAHADRRPQTWRRWSELTQQMVDETTI
jgi:hypothetical protein